MHHNVNPRIISIGTASAAYQQRLNATIKFESEPRLDAEKNSEAKEFFSKSLIGPHRVVQVEC
jgi:hypothetical protein